MRADTLPTPVTVVSALPGYGKTTWLAPLRLQDGTVWVDVPPDGDPGRTFDAALADPTCRVLVVDDAHLLDPDCHAAEALARALDRPPKAPRVVVSGRPPLRLPISGCLARGHATEIGEAELALQPTRVAEVLGSRLGAAAVPLAGLLHEYSAGWPAIVQLAISELAQFDPNDWARCIDVSCAPGGMCLDYLNEHVLAGLTPAERSVTQLVAHADSPSAATVTASGLDPTGAVINDLVRSHVLRRSSRDRSSALGLVPVLGAAVRASMPMSSRDLVAQLIAAGRVLVADGQVDEGLTVLANAGDTGMLSEVLAEHGDQLLRVGKIDVIIDAARAIPESARSPEIVMHLGQALQVRGDYEGALDCYEQLAGDTAELPPGLAWRMGVIHYLNGEPRRADEYYQRGRLGGEDTADEAHLLGWMASAAWMTGDGELCANLAQRSLDAARRSGETGALATAHVALGLHAGLSGSRRELAEHYERAIDYAEQAGDLLQGVRARSNLAAHRTAEGQLDRALDDLTVAGRLAQEAGFAAFEALCQINSGEALVQLGRLDDAMAAFEAAKAIYQRMGSRKVAYALNGIGDIHRITGSLSLARAAYGESVAAIEKGEDLQAQVPAQSGLARVLGPSDPERAKDLARQALQPAGPGQALAWLTLGWLALDGSPEEARHAAASAEEVAAQHRDWAALAESHELAALAGDPADRGRLLREAEHSWTQAGSNLGLLRLRYVRGRLRKPGAPGTDAESVDAGHRLEAAGVALEGPHAAGILAAVPAVAVPRIHVITLGRFAITVDGEDVDVTRWQSRKARTLLKILAARRGAPVNREELMDALWPGVDPAELANRLAVAVTALRRGLDPQHEHPADWIVVSKSGALSLNLEHTTVDLVNFTSAAESGLRLASADHPQAAQSVLESAARTYGGAFLPADPYDDWAASVRDDAAGLLARCLCALADLALERGDHDAAFGLAQRALDEQPGHPRALDLLARRR